MRAIIYHLNNQRDIAEKLLRFLRQHVFYGMAATFCDVEAISLSELANQYFKLLQAAVDPEIGLTFNVKRQEYTSYRLYIEVWHYFSTGAVDPKLCFPAVAIEGRMVLVPKGLSSRFGKPVFRSFEAKGLLEVDCAVDEDLEGAVKVISEHFRTDAKRTIQGYSLYIERGTPIEVGAVAERLAIDPEYLRYLLRSEALERVLYERVYCDVQPRTLPLGRWTKVLLSIDNQCDEDLADVCITIRGPVRVRPAPVTANVPSHGVVHIPIALIPDDIGEFPVEIKMALPQDSVFTEWLPVQHLWLACEQMDVAAAIQNLVEGSTVPDPGVVRANLAKFERSGNARRWVRDHASGWNHSDWLKLLSDMREQGYWPIDEEALGVLIEGLHSSM